MRRRGFTLVEILVVMAVIGLIMAAVWSLFGHGVETSQRISGTLDAQRALRARLQGLIHELQGARKLYFPSPGGKSQEGVGFVDRSGSMIMVLVKEEGGERLLYRVDMNARTRKVLARGVKVFRATVPPLEAGQLPRNVNLTFGLEAKGTEDQEGKLQTLHMVTSVTLRSLEEEFPN